MEISCQNTVSEVKLNLAFDQQQIVDKYCFYFSSDWENARDGVIRTWVFSEHFAVFANKSIWGQNGVWRVSRQLNTGMRTT